MKWELSNTKLKNKLSSGEKNPQLYNSCSGSWKKTYSSKIVKFWEILLLEKEKKSHTLKNYRASVCKKIGKTRTSVNKKKALANYMSSLNLPKNIKI